MKLSEAKTKICPIRSQVDDAKCCADNCIAWSWRTLSDDTDYRKQQKHKDFSEQKGYCNLIKGMK